MKAYMVESEDGGTQYFLTKEPALVYAQQWALDYADGDSAAAAQVLKDIGPRVSQIEIRES